jgi:hypothetical protein
VENMKPVINIRRCLWSVKRKRHITHATSTGDTGDSVHKVRHSTEVPGLSYVESSYKRRPFMPSLNSLYVSGLTPTEVSLGAALVLARRRRRKH